MKRSSFCDGWEFARGEGAFERVVVPHDAMLGNRRGPNAPAGSASGYYYGDNYHYRKRFELSEEQAAGVVELEFEGVYRDARICVNGVALDVPPYGFVPFFVDLTGKLCPGENLVEVWAGNTDQPDCRWYSGGGIHRAVWLWESGRERIFPEGVRVTTLSIAPAKVRVNVEATGGTALVSIVDAQGSERARGSASCVAGSGSVELVVESAALWSPEAPNLYRCLVQLQTDGRIVDQASVTFGIRSLEWATDGLKVNGEEVLLRGGCIHCDNGILGAASFPASEQRRITLLKQAGFNAVRVAHNPASKALLDACDKVGMFVMDEAWDMWFTRKSAHDYSQYFLDWCDHDLRRLASHDYNHPSVILYSIGNEVADPLLPEGVALERSMVELLHSLDSTRPVTCGLNLTMMVMERAGRGWYDQADGVADPAGEGGAPRGSMLFNLAAQASGTGMTLLANVPGADKLVSPALDALDIAGYNYAAARYLPDSRKHPNRIMVGTETFPHELDRNWRLVEKIPALVGDFMWAGWDYLGEAGAGAWAYSPEEAGFSKAWPWLIAGSGALDILGQPNAHAALAGAVWKALSAPSIQVRPVNNMDRKTYRATWRGSDAIPSWSWAGCEGMPAEVEVYDARAYAIRLELDGRVLGTERVRRFVARFKTTYVPGTLRAVALDERGRGIASSTLSSAQGPLQLRVEPEPSHTAAGDVACVAVRITDALGVVESNADELLEARVEGGELLAFGSARPATVESYLTGSYTAYRGCALAVVYRGKAGEATLNVRGATLPEVAVKVRFSD